MSVYFRMIDTLVEHDCSTLPGFYKDAKQVMVIGRTIAEVPMQVGMLLPGLKACNNLQQSKMVCWRLNLICVVGAGAAVQ